MAARVAALDAAQRRLARLKVTSAAGGGLALAVLVGVIAAGTTTTSAQAQQQQQVDVFGQTAQPGANPGQAQDNGGLGDQGPAFAAPQIVSGQS